MLKSTCSTHKAVAIARACAALTVEVRCPVLCSLSAASMWHNPPATLYAASFVTDLKVAAHSGPCGQEGLHSCFAISLWYGFQLCILAFNFGRRS